MNATRLAKELNKRGMPYQKKIDLVVYDSSIKCEKEGSECILRLMNNNGEEVKVTTKDYGDDLTCLEEGKVYRVIIQEFPIDVIKQLHLASK